MSTTKGQNPSNPDDNQQQPDPNAAILARLEALEKQNAELLAAQQQASVATPAAKAKPEDKGGVWVKQWRTIQNEGKSLEKVDEGKQFYAADVWERMTTLRDGKDEADMKDSFAHNGYSYEIIEDTRV